MGTVSTFTFTSDTETVTRAKLNLLVSNLLTEFNGNISNANISGSAAIAASKLDLSTISQAITFSGNVILGTANQGDIFYDNGTITARLPPGTSGYSVVSRGTLANPTYRNVGPIGVPLPWLTSSAPADHILLDGSNVSRTTYASLFALWSTTFGVGDGTTTFGLPNIKGKTFVGFDSSQTEFDTIGKTGGEKTHTLTTAEVPNLSVDIPTRNSNGDGTTIQASDAQNQSHTVTVSTTNGGGGAHNNLQPYFVGNWITRYQ